MIVNEQQKDNQKSKEIKCKTITLNEVKRMNI